MNARVYISKDLDTPEAALAFLSDYQLNQEFSEQLHISLSHGTNCWYLPCLIDCRDFNSTRSIKMEILMKETFTVGLL